MQDVSKLSKTQLQELVGEQAVELATKDELLVTKDKQLTTKEELLATQTKEVLRRDDVIKQLEAKIEELKKDYLKLWQERFAAKSERYISDADQLRIDFGDTDEAADAAEGLAEAVEEADLIPEHRRRKPRKKRDESLPAHLPREEIIVDVDEAEKTCPTHGEKQQLPESMWDVREQMVFVPGYLYVKRLLYPTYACVDEPACGLTTADRPTGIVEGDKYDTSVATEILVSKYGYHLPVYRQQDRFAGTGWVPSRSTMLNILVNCHFIIWPLLEYFKRIVSTDPIVACDDTGVTLLYPKVPPNFDLSDPKQKRMAEVFTEALEEKKPSIKAKIWAYRGSSIKLNVFDFTVSRHRDGPDSFFAGYQGTILGDCWHGFGAIAAASDGAIVRAACNSHARRKFEDALDYPADRRRWMAWYQELFDIETRGKALSDEERLQLRQSESKTTWAKMREELDAIDQRTAQVVLPKSDLRKALNYLRNHWTELTRYLDDPKLPIDNNLCEQLMREIALGRKNWLFCGSVAGGERTAGFLTLVSSAHRNDLDVWAYVNDILKRLLAGETDYDPMLPWNWAATHPEHIRKFRQQERRQRDVRKKTKRAKRRARLLASRSKK